MIGHAVEPDGAGAAIALVAALLDAEPAMVAQLIQCDGIHAEKLAPKPNAVTTVRLERLSQGRSRGRSVTLVRGPYRASTLSSLMAVSEYFEPG